MWSTATVLGCALSLLARGETSLPPISLIEQRPADVSAQAEAFVRAGDHTIFLLTASRVFKQAQRASLPCGEVNALKKLASVIIHEEWHVRHGRGEADAYVAQLRALVTLNAGPGNPMYEEVFRAMRAVLARTRVEGRPTAAKAGDPPAVR